MDNSFKSLVDTANSILILLPTKPNFDQVAAGLSFYLGLKDSKNINISSPTPMLVEFNRLVGVTKIGQELGNKNLTVRFIDYPASDIERVSYDIENGQFRLSVIPKTGFAAPKKEQVELSYAGVSADLVVLLGGENESNFPALASSDLAGAKIVHIGTRVLSNTFDRPILSFARPASSVSEIVYTLIHEVGGIIDADVATNLLAGIEEGSQYFKGQDVTAETFEIVAHLLRAGGQRIPSMPQLGTYPSGAIPGEKLVSPSEPEKKEPAPKDWLEPKIYKGTSVS